MSKSHFSFEIDHFEKLRYSWFFQPSYRKSESELGIEIVGKIHMEMLSFPTESWKVLNEFENLMGSFQLNFSNFTCPLNFQLSCKLLNPEGPFQLGNMIDTGYMKGCYQLFICIYICIYLHIFLWIWLNFDEFSRHSPVETPNSQTFFVWIKVTKCEYCQLDLLLLRLR